jgi:cold shock CspA family protein
MSQMRGTVVTWIPRQGIGFIKPDLGRQDVFLHASSIAAGHVIFEGARVEFTKKVNPAPRGLARANDVKVIKH